MIVLMTSKSSCGYGLESKLFAWPKSDVNLGKECSGAHEDGLSAAAPDLVEEREPELIDNVVPTLGYSLIPMVGLGGSAGSIAALQEFFNGCPRIAG
jgi:hypothetical protein